MQSLVSVSEGEPGVIMTYINTQDAFSKSFVSRPKNKYGFQEISFQFVHNKKIFIQYPLKFVDDVPG